MRLIDADALSTKVIFVCEDGYDGADMVLKKDIDNAPTIEAEPVKHGRWEHIGGDEWCCTNCGEVVHTEGSWEKPTYKYCHECGADMRERRDSV